MQARAIVYALTTSANSVSACVIVLPFVFREPRSGAAGGDGPDERPAMTFRFPPFGNENNLVHSGAQHKSANYGCLPQVTPGGDANPSRECCGDIMKNGAVSEDCAGTT